MDQSNKEPLAAVESCHKLILGPTQRGETLTHRHWPPRLLYHTDTGWCPVHLCLPSPTAQPGLLHDIWPDYNTIIWWNTIHQILSALSGNKTQWAWQLGLQHWPLPFFYTIVPKITFPCSFTRKDSPYSTLLEVSPSSLSSTFPLLSGTVSITCFSSRVHC